MAFYYKIYGIYSDHSNFKDVGSSTTGPGNIFFGDSVLENNQFRYNGTAIHYCDPSYSFALTTNTALLLLAPMPQQIELFRKRRQAIKTCATTANR